MGKGGEVVGEGTAAVEAGADVVAQGLWLEGGTTPSGGSGRARIIASSGEWIHEPRPPLLF